MHVPDGFFDAPTALASGAAAAAGVTVAVRRAGAQLEDHQVPLAGLTAAYIFAVQMLNFPVAAGTSGHLLGGALAAVLVGPWVAALCMTVVLGVQALVFADGGLSALGVNVVLMGFVSVFVGYAAYLALRRLLPASPRTIPVAAAAGGWFAVVASAAVFVALYAVGGAGDVSLWAVAGAMVGVHSVIGIGEAAITFLTVAAVVGARPDLLHRPPEDAVGSAVVGVRP